MEKRNSRHQFALHDINVGSSPNIRVRVRNRCPPPNALPPPEKQPKVMKVRMWLRVENNSKFVRGKGKVREEIERQILSRYCMEKPNKERGEYLLAE